MGKNNPNVTGAGTSTAATQQQDQQGGSGGAPVPWRALERIRKGKGK